MGKRVHSCALVLLGLILLGAFPCLKPQAQPGKAARPKLIVIIVIDQFRYDYLTRFRSQFAERGFNLLLGGANLVNCRYDYATTATCPGHASLYTGAYPDIHGIIGNEWYDSAEHKAVYCVGDSNTTLVGGREGPGFSPHNLIGTTLGDELRIATNFRSKVISISLKDRASVIPGGHTANAAYWYQAETGHFVTSTYYMQSLPEWVSRFNDTRPAKAYCGKSWEPLTAVPGAQSKPLKEFSAQPGEPCPDEKFLRWLDNTPYMTEIELRLASDAVAAEHLGQGPATDLLAVSLSENDYIGHAYGPYSPEVADVTLRTDRYLENFFQDLDKFLGLQNVWIALSADHGVSPNPQFIKEHHLGAGHISLAQLKAAVENNLTDAFGEGPWVESISDSYIYLNRDSLTKRHADRVSAEAAAAEAALSVAGVRMAFTRTQILTGSLPNSPLSRKAASSFSNMRSGDVFLELDSFALPVAGETGTTHGSPWNYDAQVPLIFWGSAFKPGTYAIPCQPIDLAPTLAAALGLTQPSGAQGQPLTVALQLDSGLPLLVEEPPGKPGGPPRQEVAAPNSKYKLPDSQSGPAKPEESKPSQSQSSPLR